MITLIKRFWKKYKLHKELNFELDRLTVYNFYNMLDEVYETENYDDVLKMIEKQFLQKGLSQKDIDRVKKNREGKFIRVE